MLVLAMLVAVAAGCGRSSVTVSSEGSVIVRKKPSVAPTSIPNLFYGNRTHLQSHGVLIISADRDGMLGKQVTRVWNVTTGQDVVDPAIFETSLATRVALGVVENRRKFEYGENELQMELVDPVSGDPFFSNWKVVLRDHSVGQISQNTATISGDGRSVGQVGILSNGVQVQDGIVLTTGFVSGVFQ